MANLCCMQNNRLKQVSLILFLFLTIIAHGNKSSDYIDSAKMALLNPDSSAMYYLDDAIRFAESDLEEAEALKYKGIWNYYRLLNDEALSYYQEALSVLNNYTEESIRPKANVYNNIALIKTDVGEIDSALYYYNLSKDILWEINDTAGLITLSYTNMIGLFISQGNYPKALEYSQTMLGLADQSGNMFYSANAYDFAGSIFEIQENYEDAKSAYEAALSIRKHMNDSVSISRSLTNLGIIFYRDGDYEAALDYSLKALEIKRLYNDIKGVTSTYNNLGLIYQAMDSFQLSLDMYMKAYEIGRQMPGHSSLLASINITAVALELKDIQMAYEFATQAYDDAKNTNNAKHLKEAALNFALVKAERQEYKDAYNYLLEFVSLQDSLFNEEITRKLTEKQLSYEYRKVAQKDSIQNAERIQSERLAYENRIGKQKYRFAIALFSLILVLLLAVFIISYNRNKQKVVNAALERKSAEIETSLLRAQMNPHFIFNSMNSIQNFIGKNDGLQAERYLAKFARLIRLILDNSSKSFVPLEDEIALIENYLEIETLRLDGKLSYEISISDQLNVEDILIPSMLIQPYVENAILHGIVPKDGDGKIRVVIKEGVDCNCLNVLVEDNGIGRKASQDRKQLTNHKSVGMRITKDRLALLSKHEQSKASVHVEDIIEDGELCGTRVEIVLPIKNDF